MVVQAVVVPSGTFNNQQMPMKLAFYNEDGTPYDLGNGAEVVLTGYVISPTGGALAATDTVNQALAKLEKRVATLEAA
jgi:hypothetical protein